MNEKVIELKKDLSYDLKSQMNYFEEYKKNFIDFIKDAKAGDIVKMENYTQYSQFISCSHRITDIEARMRVVDYLMK
jgi:hypothetical protein